MVHLALVGFRIKNLVNEDKGSSLLQWVQVSTSGFGSGFATGFAELTADLSSEGGVHGKGDDSTPRYLRGDAGSTDTRLRGVPTNSGVAYGIARTKVMRDLEPL